MNTPNWMMDAPSRALRRAKSVRHNRRSTDRRRLTPDVALAFCVMLATIWVIYELTSVLLR